MQTTIEKEPKTRKRKEKVREPYLPDLELVEEIRDPKPLEAGACWCPGIGRMVVTTTTFPILLGRC